MTLEELKKQTLELQKKIAEGQEDMEKYSRILEQQEQQEKIKREERLRNKAKVSPEGMTEKDSVNMYVILTNEQKLGRLYRDQEDFFAIYEDDFPALSKEEIIDLRNSVIEEMRDPNRVAHYADSFKKRSVKERFTVSTLNLHYVSDMTEIDKKAAWAINNTKEWFIPSEYNEVKRLMDDDLEVTRNQLDEQLSMAEQAWTKFTTAREFLQIVINDKKDDDSDLEKKSSNFQVVIEGNLVEVLLATKGIFKISTVVQNCYTWYWGVSVQDIWEEALLNEVSDERKEWDELEGEKIAKKAVKYIRSKY